MNFDLKQVDNYSLDDLRNFSKAFQRKIDEKNCIFILQDLDEIRELMANKDAIDNKIKELEESE